MTNDLIKINPNGNIGGEQINTVNARDLWRFLDSKQDFSSWIKSRIRQYGFVENQDFVTFHKIVERKIGRGASRSTEYHLSIDMAKELSMVERTFFGKQARQYFIECERRAKAAAPQLTERQMLDIAYTELRKVEAELEVTKPKAIAFDDVATRKGSLSLREAAKILEVAPDTERNTTMNFGPDPLKLMSRRGISDEEYHDWCRTTFYDDESDHEFRPLSLQRQRPLDVDSAEANEDMRIAKQYRNLDYILEDFDL